MFLPVILSEVQRSKALRAFGTTKDPIGKVRTSFVGFFGFTAFRSE
jgi:hypothetical protein